MTLFKTLTRGAGLGLCVVAFAGTALADPGNGKGNPPATPPGQEKKTAGPIPPPAPVARAAAAHGQAAQGRAEQGRAEQGRAEENRAAQRKERAERRKAKPAEKAAASPRTKEANRRAEKAKSRPATAQPKPATSSKGGQSSNAHHHVIVCHRTGSRSNPYVVINIPYTAWLNAHSPSSGAHPPKNGHDDILLKDPASRPGSKDGFTKAACGASATTVTPPATASMPPAQQSDVCPASTTTTERVLVGVWHATGARKNGERKYVYIKPSPGSAHYTKHEDDRPVYETRAVTRKASADNCATGTSTSNTSGPPKASRVETSQTSQPVQSSRSRGSGSLSGVPAPASGVAGATSPPHAASAGTNKPAGGVLGGIVGAPEAIARTATTGTLPFTGIPLWIAALIGGTLLAGGLMLRRGTAS